MASVRLHGLVVQRDGSDILHVDDIFIDDGEFIGVVGASGAGKTTLLRAVAGLERLTAGLILVDGVDVTTTRPRERDVSMVFQTPSLIPHRDVRRNVAFPLELRHRPPDEIDTRVAAEVRAWRIESLLDRSPRSLSAGEAQLVQVARAMVRVPTILLLDEPLSRLDASIRHLMRHELRILQRGYGVTTLFTTNDPHDAMALADRLIVIADGSVVQFDEPMEVYEHPATLGAALLTGEAVVHDVRVRSAEEGFWLDGPDLHLRAWAPALARHAGRRLQMMVRPTWRSNGHIDRYVLFDPVSGAAIV